MAIPVGESGRHRVERFSVSETEAELHNLRGFFGHEVHRRIRAGEYTRLMRGPQIVMSNAPAELRDHASFVRQAHGRVLVHGLGLGCVLSELIAKDSVDHVTVVEISDDVVNLVWPAFEDSTQVEIVRGSAFTWKPAVNRQWDCCWHDIWDNITSDNLPEMIRLHRRFGRRCGFQMSWCRDECERLR